MKKLVFLIFCFIVHSVGYSQIIENIDEISPFHEEFAAIKKGDQWAFINSKGVQVINFRDDLVSSKNETGITFGSYPVLRDGRCLIRKITDNVYHYGYIDSNGKEIIASQYVNATNFQDGYAIVIYVEKKVMGYNKVLGKDVISYTLKESIIDTSGKTVKDLDNARNYVKSKYNLQNPPVFYSKFLGSHLIAVQTTDAKKWNIYKF